MPTLDDIVSGVSDARSTPDEQTKAESVDYQTERQKLLNESIRQKQKLRSYFAIGLAVLTIVWLLAVLAIVVCCGFNLFMLSDAVLIALITTTTVSVLGILAIVVRYLFPTGIEN